MFSCKIQFPFFISFFCWNEINKKSSIKKKHEKNQKQLPQSVTLFQQEKTWERSEAVASACNFIKKETLPQVLSYEFEKFLRTPFLTKRHALAASKRWKLVKPITLQIIFFTDITGNRVSDHYARNIYITVFQYIAVPVMLMSSEILYQNINKFVWKYLQ